MKKFKHETIIVSKEAARFIWDLPRKVKMTDEWFNREWNKAFRNGGANPKTHPISENEVRISVDNICFSLDEAKRLLTENGFTYRTDGFIVDGFYA